MSQGREFKSFRDLKRSAGGDGEDDSAPEKDKGWTLESADEVGPGDGEAGGLVELRVCGGGL